MPDRRPWAVVCTYASAISDPQARDQFLDRLKRDGAVSDYLLRLRRVDLTLIWVEVTAQAEPGAKGSASR